MKNSISINSVKGSAELMVIIIIVVLVIGVGAYKFINKTSIEKNNEGNIIDKNVEKIELSESVDIVDDIDVIVPELNFSASPLSDLNVSSLNVSVAQISTNNIFFAPLVNSDFSYNPNLNISIPNLVVNFDMPSIPTIPTNIPEKENILSSTPLASPIVVPASLPGNTGQPQTDCSLFLSVPSCSYVGTLGSQGYESCKQCYPNK